MELTIFQQILDQLAKASRVLIALPAVLTPDNAASALALGLFLKKMNKEVEVVSAGSVPPALSFLPGIGNIKNALPGGNSLMISVDLSATQLDEISYETQGTQVNIFVKPKSGEFTPADVTLSASKPPYQVIVVLDAASLEHLGSLFDHNADVFFNTPKINIDNKAANQSFGAINFIDINASSIAEMLSDLLSAYEGQLIDEDIATCLLAGIITKTNSFQHVQTTPKAFLKASQLVSLGGRQQEVVKFLYKTKPLPLLRLWGRALARLKIADHVPALYSMLSQSDYEKAEADETQLVPVLRELLENVSNYKIVALISERSEGGVQILAAAHPQVALDSFAQILGVPMEQKPAQTETCHIYEAVLPGSTLVNAEEKFVEAMEKM